MAWPPTIPPNTRTNADPQQDTHPSDHNQISTALTEIKNRLTMPAVGNVVGGGPSFGGTYVNILTASAPPPAAGTGPCVLHAVGNVQFFPRNTGPLLVQEQLLVAAVVGPSIPYFLPAGTGQPTPVTSMPLTYCMAAFSSPPAGNTSIVLRAASSDGVLYPTTGACWISWFWTH